jgi:hypothetical protein
MVISESDITIPVPPTPSVTPKGGEHIEDCEDLPLRPDPKYCAEKVGKGLAEGMAQIVQLLPRDPIEFLGHYLKKYAAIQKWRAEVRSLDLI